MTPACDQCGEPARLVTRDPDPPHAGHWYCTPCALDVEYVRVVSQGAQIVWEHAQPTAGGAT